MQAPVGVLCPKCGREKPRLLSQVASQRLADLQPYLFTFVFECNCGATFTVPVERESDGKE